MSRQISDCTEFGWIVPGDLAMHANSLTDPSRGSLKYHQGGTSYWLKKQ